MSANEQSAYSAALKEIRRLEKELNVKDKEIVDLKETIKLLQHAYSAALEEIRHLEKGK